MEEQVKNIVSRYIKVEPAQINAQTVIDRSAVSSSIVLHRMYAQLANEGFAAENFTEIRTFGQLLTAVNNKNFISAEIIAAGTDGSESFQSQSSAVPSIGIDAESVRSLPVVNDFREDQFYKMNFSSTEIAYCILQTDPYASFTGLFAAKEAIIKADNAYQEKAFNSIIIDHLPGGKPIHPGFHISISHTSDLAIAVAVKNNFFPANDKSTSYSAGGGSPVFTFAAVAAFLLSVFTLLLLLFKTC